MSVSGRNFKEAARVAAEIKEVTLNVNGGLCLECVDLGECVERATNHGVART